MNFVYREIRHLSPRQSLQDWLTMPLRRRLVIFLLRKFIGRGSVDTEGQARIMILKAELWAPWFNLKTSTTGIFSLPNLQPKRILESSSKSLEWPHKKKASRYWHFVIPSSWLITLQWNPKSVSYTHTHKASSKFYRLSIEIKHVQ